MTKDFSDMKENPARFWENLYQSTSSKSSGIPSVALRQFIESLTPGRALELGCAKGDDAVWLAQKGWDVVAVDISQTALNYTAENAAQAHLSDHITCEYHNLSETFPNGEFDLITACFLPAFPFESIIQRAAQAIVSGGHLLVVNHESRAPWSWDAPDTQYPTAENILSSLSLNEKDWQRIYVNALERKATGPNEETAIVKDSVIFLRRL